MKLNFVNRLVATAALATLAFSASATTPAPTSNTINGSSFTNGASTYTQSFVNGLATFTSTPGSFKKKTQGGNGVGISGGRTGDEIDIGETLTGSFANGVIVSSLTLGVLFDGPEYKDVNEIAQITATYKDGTSGVFTLTAKGSNIALWSLGTSIVSSIGSGAVQDGTGAWSISNPFGNMTVKSLSFTAVPGIAAKSCHNCTNQSDFTFVSMTGVTPVPEPETYAMLLAGLGLMGAIARRRRNQA